MSSSAVISTSNWRRRIGLPLALVGMASAWMLVGTPAAVGANARGLTGSEFQTTDGNLTVETPSSTQGMYDWDNLNNHAGDDDPDTKSDTFTVTMRRDKDSGSGDDSFGNGTKEDTPVPSIVAGSIPPNKSDLLEFGSWVEKGDGGQFLHLFWSRVQEPSGTTNMDFELNAKSCPTVASGDNRDDCSTNGVTPVRSVDDLLVTYDLSRGGSTAAIGLKKWDGSAWVPDALSETEALGSINTAAITTASSLTGRTYSLRTFGEASIDLDAIFDTDDCTTLGSAYLKSRSSDSFTSAVKDFVAPIGVDISNCGRLVVQKIDQDGDPLDGASFEVDPTPGVEDEDVPDARGMTDLGDGLFCLDDLRYGVEYTVTETAPAGYTGVDPFTFTPDEAYDSGSCTGVDADTTPVLEVENERILGSLLVKKLGEAEDLLTGAEFSWVGPGEETGTGSVPETETEGLYCADNLVPGAYVVTEDDAPPGYQLPADPFDATVSAGDDCATRISAAVAAAGDDPVDYGENLEISNSPSPGTINVAKEDDDGGPLDGVGFTLYADLDGDGTFDAPDDDGIAEEGEDQVAEGTVEQFTEDGATQFANVPLGDYCVVETTGKPGYGTAAAQCTTIGLEEGGQTVPMTFVNPQQHKVIVLVCHEGTATLVDGTASYLAGEADDVTTAVTSDLPEGVVDADLCGLPGRGGYSHDDSPAVDVEIPGHS